jgi:hypothetical protein
MNRTCEMSVLERDGTSLPSLTSEEGEEGIIDLALQEESLANKPLNSTQVDP